MKNSEMKKARKAVKLTAKKESISVDNVREEIKAAIAEGLSSNDPAVREMWKGIPCRGEVPEPEEVIAWAAEMVRAKMKNKP